MASTVFSRQSSGSRRSPSPCDSGVGELEAILREKEMELEKLRERMEANESAMIQVFEEKRQHWEAEMMDRCRKWELKLRSQQQKSFRTEQSLLLQIFKLQKDNKVLRQGLENVNKACRLKKADCDDNQQELRALKERVEELMWEQGQKNNEVELLKTQLKYERDTVVAQSTELASVKNQLREVEKKLEFKHADVNMMLPGPGASKKLLRRL